MARESCIAHPKEEDFFIVRRAYFELTGKDKIQAVLLWALEYFTTDRLREMRQYKQSGDPWIEYSVGQFGDELFGFLSPRRLPEALAELEKAGWVKIRKPEFSGGKTKYLFLIDEAQQRVNEWAASSGDYKYVYIGQMSEGRDVEATDNCPSSLGQLSEDHRTNVRTYKEEEEYKNIKKEESPIIPFSEKPQTPDIPETDVCSVIEAAPPPPAPPPRETDLDTPIDKFVPVAYRQEGRSRPKDLAKSKDWLRTVEKEYGPDEFRWLLRCYLQADTPALRKAGWPLRMFLRSPTMNAVYEPTPARIPGPAPVSGPDPDPISLQPALPNPADIVAAWNALIPEKAVSASSRPAVLRDQEFVAVHADVFAKVRARLDEKRPDDWWIDFGWVCGTKDGVANWNKIRSGKLSGSFTNGAAKPSAADRHRALAEKLIRDSRARQAEKAPTGTGVPHPPAPAG